MDKIQTDHVEMYIYQEAKAGNEESGDVYTYIDQLSQKEAGELLDISQMHVSRIQRKAIKKLQETISETTGGVS